MNRKRLTKGQVLMGSVGFILLMGLVGSIDRESQQALLDEKVAIRDVLKASYEEEERLALAHHNMRSKP